MIFHSAQIRPMRTAICTYLDRTNCYSFLSQNCCSVTQIISAEDQEVTDILLVVKVTWGWTVQAVMAASLLSLTAGQMTGHCSL